MPIPPGLVVVGGGPAGVAAAAAFRETDPDTSITIVQAEDSACYWRPRLPEVVAGSLAGERILLYPPDWYTERNLGLRLGTAAESIDREARRIRLASGDVLSYRRLVLAPGAEPIHPSIAGLPLPKVHVLRTLADAEAIRTCARGHRVAALVGGGLLGLEAGYALTRLGLRVVVIENGSRILPRQTDDEGSAKLQQRLAPLGFEFFAGTSVRRVVPRGGQVVLNLADGAELAVDLVLISAGVRPHLGLAEAAGLACGRGIQVDDYLRTSDSRIYAAGDAAEWRGRVSGLWSAAQAMGRVAGRNAAGDEVPYVADAPYAALKVAGVPLVSQGELQPERARVLVHCDDPAGVWIKLFIRDERLIGALQIGTTAGARRYQELIRTGRKVEGGGEALVPPGKADSMPAGARRRCPGSN